jgi:hypothetical protein
LPPNSFKILEIAMMMEVKKRVIDHFLSFMKYTLVSSYLSMIFKKSRPIVKIMKTITLVLNMNKGILKP